MQIPLDKAWKLLGPRITTLITTINEKGEINAAPYSFVGSMSFNPPLIWVGFMKNQVRHTYDNIKKTKEFVINVVSEEFAEEAIECGKIAEKCSELEKVKLEWEDSEVVKVPKIKKARIVLECKYRQELDIGGSHRIIIGEIIKAVAQDVNENLNPNQEKMKTIFHANGPDFYKIGKHIELNWGKKKKFLSQKYKGLNSVFPLFMIKTIVVDLGGVYFQAGTKIALEKIYKLVNVPREKADEIFHAYLRKEGWLYRRGKISKEEFWKAAVKKLKIDEKLVPKIQEIWHSSYSPTQGMKELVSKLRENYRVVAFSGNIKERIEYLNERYGLNNDFDNFVLSFDVGFNKWEREFYKILLEKIGDKPEEYLFVDDTQKFLDIAKSFGMKTLLFKNTEQLKSDLRKLNIRI